MHALINSHFQSVGGGSKSKNPVQAASEETQASATDFSEVRVSSSAARAAVAPQNQTFVANRHGESVSSSVAQAAKKQPAASDANRSSSTAKAAAAAVVKSKTARTAKVSRNLIVDKDVTQHSLTFCLRSTLMQSPKNVKLREVSFASCQHDDKEAYVMLDDKSYFSKKYLENTPTWPSTCAKKGCTSGSFGQAYKVGINHPVYCCSNAKNKNHPCMHAYCKPCFDEWQTGEGAGKSPRKRRRRCAVAV